MSRHSFAEVCGDVAVGVDVHVHIDGDGVPHPDGDAHVQWASPRTPNFARDSMFVLVAPAMHAWYHVYMTQQHV